MSDDSDTKSVGYLIGQLVGLGFLAVIAGIRYLVREPFAGYQNGDTVTRHDIRRVQAEAEDALAQAEGEADDYPKCCICGRRDSSVSGGWCDRCW